MSFLDLSPQLSLAFGTSSFENNYLEQLKNKQTTKKIKAIAQTMAGPVPAIHFCKGITLQLSEFKQEFSHHHHLNEQMHKAMCTHQPEINSFMPTS